jgi:cell division protease FtsH
MVGADLANLVNEAALLAARRNHTEVTALDFGDALEKVVLGAERKIMLGPGDRERTAYHEAGHAIVGMLTEGADPVRKVSIIPRGMSLGVTFSAPEDDRFSYEEPYLQAKIKVALGGRAAEEVVYNERSSGAESDIEQLTAIVPRDGTNPLVPGAEAPSPHTQELVDQEVRRIVDQAYDEVLTLLRDNRDKLENLAHALLGHETLEEPDAYAAAGVERRPRPDREEQPVPAAT